MIRTKLFKFAYNTNKILMSTSTQTAANDKKLEHYRHLNAIHDTDAKPAGWDEAKPFESIPGPKPLPVVGNAWRFMIPKIGDLYGMDYLDIHKHMYKTYGKIAIIKGLLGSTQLLLFNADDFEMLYRNEGVWPIRQNLPSLDYYMKTRENIVPNLTALSEHGEKWFKFRSVVNPILMQPRNILNYTDKMDLVAGQLVDNMTHLAQQNKDGEMPSDFRNEIYKWSLESVAVVTLDTHLGCLKRSVQPDSEPQKMISSALQFFDLMFRLDILPSMWKYYSTPDWKQYVKVLDFLIHTNIKHITLALDKLEKEEIDTENETKSVLQQLLKKDRNVAVAMAVGLMLAGIDTTGRVLGAGLYYLAKNPETQEQLRKEATTLLKTKDTPITKEAIGKAHYLKAVLKETTRLAPIGVGNMRTTVKDLVLGGYQIPKGTNVLTSNLLLCSMEEHFPRAKEFLPERWLSSGPEELSHKTANPFVFSPFGYGPRSCLGKRLASLELEVALLKIVRNFELKWPHEDMTFATTTLYGMAKPLKIQIKPLDQ